VAVVVVAGGVVTNLMGTGAGNPGLIGGA